MPSKKQSTICRTLKWFSAFKTTYCVSPVIHFEKEKEFLEEGLHLIQFLNDNTQRQHNKCWKCTSLQNTHLLKLCLLSSIQRYAYGLVRFRVRKRSCGIALKYLVLLLKKLVGTKWFAPLCWNSFRPTPPQVISCLFIKEHDCCSLPATAILHLRLSLAVWLGLGKKTSWLGLCMKASWLGLGKKTTCL